MELPPPRAKLFGCIWLPRIIAKARLACAQQLPPEYAARFGARDGVDGVFLSHFQLSKEDLLAAAEGNAAGLSAWFHALPGMGPGRVDRWNHLAVNLGRPGYPLEARFPLGLATTYAHVAHLKPATVFEMLEADEGLVGGVP